jgi:hypothetical protein
MSSTKLLSRKILIWQSASSAASPFGSPRDRKSDSAEISVGLSEMESLCWELLGASTVTHAAQDEPGRNCQTILFLLAWGFRITLLDSSITREGFVTLFWLSSYTLMVELFARHGIVEKRLGRRVRSL